MESAVRLLVERLESLPDPHSEVNRRHPLGEVIVIAVCGVIVGRDGPATITLPLVALAGMASSPVATQPQSGTSPLRGTQSVWLPRNRGDGAPQAINCRPV